MNSNIMVEDNLEFAAATLSCIGDGVITTDSTGKIIYLNHPAEKIIELGIDKVIGKEFEKAINFVKAGTKEVIKNPIISVFTNDTITGLEHNTMIITENGSEKYVSASCSPVKKDGKTIGAVVVLRDITKLKSLEQEHIKEKDNLKAIFKHAPVGMIMLDDNANMIEVNDAALQYINRKKEQAYGKQLGDVFRCTNSFESGCGNGTKCRSCDIRKAIELSIDKGQGSNNIEFSKIFVVDNTQQEIWFRSSITPINSSGKKHIVVTLLDITENKKKEKDMIKSRDYSYNILDQIPSLVWKIDTKVECNYVNKVWRDFTGRTLEETSGDGWANVIHPEDLDKYVRHRTNAMVNREKFQLEYRLLRYDGEYRWCLDAGAPYYDLDGNCVGYIGSIYDINERKVAEDNLRRYRKTINNARDIIFFLDLDGMILEANKTATEAYGYTNEELCSMSIKSIRDDWGYTEHQLEQANQNGIFFEATHRRKDGSTFQVEVSSQGTYIGKNRIIFSVVRDITERKKVDKKILDNQIKYRSLFMNMKTGYAYYKMIYNNQHKLVNLKCVEVNEAYQQFFHLSMSNIMDINYVDFCKENNEIILDYINRFSYKLQQGESIQMNEIYFEAYNKWFDFAIYSPKKDDIVTIITDITHMKETEKKLISAKDIAENANKAKSEFLANMSHEIRTPINGMVGMVDLTLLTNLSKDQKENLITAKACANSLLNIINDILDFSKMEAGKVRIENINFNIKKLIEEIIRTHSLRINEKGLELNYTFSSAIPQFLIGDPNRLRQILNNLISNGIKFTDEGSITVTIKQVATIMDEVELLFTVSDTGIGISSGDNVKLFQSFSQLENSFTDKYAGSGLGLAISKNLVDLMGGKIGVDSERGQGSSFHFNVKFKQGFEIEQKDYWITKITKSVKQLKILLVEDDAVNQKVITKMLLENGHIIETANNGLEAIQLFVQFKYDVILMDIQMPKMNGLEANKRIKEIEKENAIDRTPIIALTAYALHGDRERFLALGFEGYVAKPIEMNELFYTLKRITEEKDSRDNMSPNKELLTENGDIIFTTNKIYKPSVMNYQDLITVSEKIKIMEVAMLSDNLMMIENRAHEIKILAIEMDAMDIKDTAFRIELAARKGNLEEIGRYIEQMKTEMETRPKIDII